MNRCLAPLAALLSLAAPAGRPEPKPYLNLPDRDGGTPPALLSRTGAFDSLRTLRPSPGLVPYDLIVPFWSDGASKMRWISVPTTTPAGVAPIRDAGSGEWAFPDGTVFVKHFEIAIDETRPEARRRLETRLLVRAATGGVYGLSYRWRGDGSDADLVTSGRVEPLAIRTPTGSRIQNWYFPGPADCRQCHTPASGGVLGVKPRQLDRDVMHPSGATSNQLREWRRLGLIADVPDRIRLSPLDDDARPIEERARSYLDANCAHCHRPGGAAADFDARFSTPLREQRLIGAPARINLGIDGARMIAPNDPWRSAILTRMETLEPTRMPPLAHETIDRRGVDLLRAWIASLPGSPVLPPPSIRPEGGELRGPVRVSLAHADPAATIRYTLDGSAPGKSSPAYAGPIEIARSTTVRARAYRDGWTRSVVVQETFILDP